MNVKRIIGILVFIVGIIAILFAHYIHTQVGEGKAKIARGEKQVEQGKQLFSLNPATKEIGKGLTGSAQRKIDAGKRTVAEYEEIARWLRIGGIVLLVLGAGVVVVSFMNKRRSKR